MDDPQDMEEQCDDTVLAICDARERYSIRCAEQLDKYLALRSDIAMEPVVLEPTPRYFGIPSTATILGREISEVSVDTPRTCYDGAERLQRVINRVQELKVAVKQLEDNKNFETKHHLI